MYKRLNANIVLILFAQTYVAFLQHDVESSGGGSGINGDGAQRLLNATSACVQKGSK